ncbi:hypothetical protein VIM7927_03886 [Vibrio mangrovi]|uniref:Uncharacterized protein n=1 Tax=Vibrio mangrovi TaxID=474394 RepID=A0A1Y6J2L3_9VIBR|nr:hypothetical protein VIM7927_03886 [Vibrio mangrovi]
MCQLSGNKPSKYVVELEILHITSASKATLVPRALYAGVRNLRKNITLNDQENESLVKKTVGILAAVAAFVVSAIAIYEFAIKPDGPKIEVVFALTGTNEITIAPEVKSQRAEWTEIFPLGLQIINSGDTEAKNVSIYLESARNLALVSQGVKIEPHLVFNNNGIDMVSHQIKVESINPGQKIHLDNDLYGYTENHVDLAVDVTFKDGVSGVIPMSVTLTHDLKVKVSASNMVQTELPLKLTLGRLDILSEKPGVIFQYTDGVLTKYRGNISNKSSSGTP